MAEAYAKSLDETENRGKYSSSGIQAKLALNGDVDPVAVKDLESDGIAQFLTPIWQQTTQEMIDSNDRLIFMSQRLFNDADTLFDIPKEKVTIWDIPDIDDIYPKIKEQVNKLV